MNIKIANRIIALISSIRAKRLALEKENLERMIRIEKEIYDLARSQEIRTRALYVMAAIAKQIVKTNLEIQACESLQKEQES